jgi:hypothetical protein
MVLYQGTTSVVPNMAPNNPGFSPCGPNEVQEELKWH